MRIRSVVQNNIDTTTDLPSNDCMVTMFHATFAKVQPAILRDGLKAGKAKGARKAVWLVGPRGFNWACRHAVCRSGGRIEDVVVLELSVPRSWLTRHGRELWFCDRDIPASRIVGTTVFKRVRGG